MTKNNKRFVFFDFDKTLTKIDTTILTSYFILKNTNRKYKFIYILLLFILFRLGLVSELFFKKALCYLILKNQNIFEIREIVIQFYKTYVNVLFNENIINLLVTYSKKGYEVYIVSSNFNFIIEPLIDFFPIDETQSTIAESINYIFTGNIKGQICNGHEKFARVSNILNKSSKIFSIGYGDGTGDYQLLNACTYSFLVKHLHTSQLKKIKLMINMLRDKIVVNEMEVIIEKFN